MRRQQDELLSSRRESVLRLEERRRELEEAVAQANAEAWHAVQQARWIKATNDGVGFSRQAAPKVVPTPPGFSVPEDAFTRAWHSPRPDVAAAQAARAAEEAARRARPRAQEDMTGLVFDADGNELSEVDDDASVMA